MARKDKFPTSTDPAPDLVTVRCDRSGVVAIGDYRPGIEYTVPADEAARLIERKGFVRVTPAAAGPAAAPLSDPEPTSEET
jgi:hypothetical protein